MNVNLFDFQETALESLRSKLVDARRAASISNPQAVAFSAPTGAGKTIVMTALFEDIFFGEPDFPAQPDAVILWLSDMPELNEQTLLKIRNKSSRIKERQLETIDASFDAERLEGGRIYFVNTQKLGSEKVLTRIGDGRQYSLWETLTNTSKRDPQKFYVVIDEAHRGTRTGKKANVAHSIMQKFLLGSNDDKMKPVPLVVGVSATPKRFLNLLDGTEHTVHKVLIQGSDVTASGLLKDRILIHFPDAPSQAEMSLLAEAAKKWQTMTKQWEEYCELEGLKPVKPIFVIQVEDGNDRSVSKTELAKGLEVVEETIGRSLRDGEVAHTFNDQMELDLGGRWVRRIEASRIEENQNIGVVLFKMSLSTGWDCPRAEVMMSFRRAQDHTYIAQLLGRMVRTPLARRISSSADLNQVHLYLPHYDEETVNQVIEDLKNVEDVPPTETGTSRELVTLYRRDGLEDVFKAAEKLITYRVGKVRSQSPLRRLMSMARALTRDEIDDQAWPTITQQIVGRMVTEVDRLRHSGELDAKIKQIMGLDLTTIEFDNATGVAQSGNDYEIDVATADVEREFDRIGRVFGNGLHMEYWRAQADTRDDEEFDEIRAEAVVVGKNHEAMESLNAFAKETFDDLYDKHQSDFLNLSEERQQHYATLRLQSPKPEAIPWTFPDSIDFNRPKDAAEYDRHIYLEKDGSFRAEIGNWEKEVLAEELTDDSVVGWLRNVERKSWALEIPYEAGGTTKPMFPDLLIVRKDAKGYLFDVLEPHDPSLEDNLGKAKGLSKFAAEHGGLFGRIELIRKQRDSSNSERFFRLDLRKSAIRQLVDNADTNNRLNEIFEEKAIVRS